MSERPAEVVTFLFTDVEGSTRLWEADPRAMSVALARHDALLHGAIADAAGTVFKTAGDAFCAVFPDPGPAITAAIAGQRALKRDVQTALSLKVRMAIHTGPAEPRGGDYFGPPLNRVSRLLDTAHGEQIVVSQATRELMPDGLVPDLTFRGLGEHALKDLQGAERVFQVVAAGLPTEFPPLRTPRRLLRNVPQPATPLIGREREAALAEAFLGLRAPGGDEADAVTVSPDIDIAQPVRLLTLTGPGGAGKTRLSLHLVSTLGGEFADGAAFVSLATLTDPALVPVAIVTALDLGEPSGDSPRDLFELLRDRHLLLVLDNLEQVMGATELVTDLLKRCPRLTMLVTSRERLSVRGEQELPLPPLALPPSSRSVAIPADATDAPAPSPLETIRQAAAVRLFIARAHSVKPDFDLTADNAEDVVEICRRLDGLPLAIELAAARARFYSPRALLERLDRFDRRLDVLSRGPRDLPARQQTMRETVAWSYDLLDPAEQRLFTRLAVFVGGAMVETCLAVAAGLPDDAPGEDAFALLESLTDKSLVQLADDGDDSRITMFETIRDYAQERLAATHEQQIMCQRHAETFLSLAEDAELLLAGSDQTHWLDRLERDQANLRAAISWLREQNHTEEALRLAGALWRFWWLRGDMSEGRNQLESLLREPATVAPAVRAKALNGAGVLADSQGDSERAERLHRESLDISRRLGDFHGIAWSLNNLGVVAINQGDYARARTLLEENLAVAEETGDTADIATALIDLGQVAHFGGDHERARTLFTRSLELFRALGDESCTARALNNLGTVLFAFGEHDRAHALLTESLCLHRHVGDRQGIASTLNNLAGAASRQGDFDTAMGYFRESHMLALEGGNPLYAAIAMEGLASLTHLHGDERVAQNRYLETLRLYRSVGDQQGIMTCLIGLASGAALQGGTRVAATLLGAASAIGEQHDRIVPPQLEEASASLRNTMGDTAFVAAWQTGRDMTIDDVVDQIAAVSRSTDARP